MVSSSESFIPKHLAIWMLVILSILCCLDVMPIRFDPLNRLWKDSSLLIVSCTVCSLFWSVLVSTFPLHLTDWCRSSCHKLTGHLLIEEFQEILHEVFSIALQHLRKNSILATRFVPTNGVQCLQHFLFWWRQIKFFTKRRLWNIISILHSWCALNSLAVMNTMFEKNIYKYTWQHPGSKRGTASTTS